MLTVLVVLVVLAGAAAIRGATETAPQLNVQRVLPASVVLPGAAPKLAWPPVGEAAVEVEGLPALGSSGPQSPMPIASVAKVMTALVVLKDHPLAPGQPGFALTVSRADVADYLARVAQQQSVVAVSEGETLDELQLLQALLVGSGNNIAGLLATHDAGTTAAFVTKMNSNARALGMTHTTYTDPSGLAPTTVSTASDQLRLAALAMANPVFAQIVALPKVTLPVAGEVSNFNTAVGTGGYVGIKTGSTSTAGGSIMFANRQAVGGHVITILGVVLGEDVGQTETRVLTSAALSAATPLVQSVKAALTDHTVVAAGADVAVVTNGSGGRVHIKANQALTTIGYGGMKVPLTVTLSRVGNHLSSGQSVASVVLGTDQTQHTMGTATSTMPSPTWRWRLTHLF